MSTDRPRAVLALLVALLLVPCAGSAGATDAPLTAGIGAGIDHTKRVHVEPAHGQLGVAGAVDQLSRPATQSLTTRQPPQGLAPTAIGGLRGLVTRNGLDVPFSAPPPVPTGARWAPARQTSRATPYVRFREYERVLGISFKIQPPQQTPEPVSQGL